MIMKDGRMVNYDTINRDMDYDKKKKEHIPGKTTKQLTINLKSERQGQDSDFRKMMHWITGMQAILRNFGKAVEEKSAENNLRYEKITERAKVFLDENVCGNPK